MPHLRGPAPLGFLSLTLSSAFLWNGLGLAVAAPQQAPPTSVTAPAPPAPTTPAAATPTPTTTPPETPVATPEPFVPPPITAGSLFKDGRALCRNKQYEPCMAMLRGALEQADKEGLPADEKALIHYVLGLALDHEEETEQAIEQFRLGAKLTPDDADIHLALAQALQSAEEYKEAKSEATRALQLGLTDTDDRTQAEAIKKKAFSAMLHERLAFDVSVSFGFDSNVLQTATRETIAGNNLAARQPTTKRELLEKRFADALGSDPTRVARTVVTRFYEGSVGPGTKPEQSELDLPITLFTEIGGRLFGTSKAEMWLGYRFYQLIMPTVKKYDPDGDGVFDTDHSSYSTQEHTFPLSLTIRPFSWWRITPRFDGFVNLTGLSDIQPFQGGFLAVLDQTFIESKLFRTRVLYQHQLRRTIDRSPDYTYLDADRDDVKVAQELRLKGGSVSARGILSYRFRSERYGGPLVIEYELPGAATACATKPTAPNMCEIRPTFIYTAPLTYQGHELALRWRLTVPLGFEFGAAASYEYRDYADAYNADYETREVLYTVDRTSGTSQDVSYSVVSQPITSISPKDRRDHMIYAELAVGKSLPQNFGLELTYGFTRNISNIVNFIDNRSYSKHSVILTATYSF